MKYIIPFLVLFLSFPDFPCFGKRLTRTIIKIEIVHDKPIIKVLSKHGFRVFDLINGNIKTFKDTHEHIVATDFHSIYIEDIKFSNKIRIVSLDSFVKVNNRVYRDTVLIKINKKGRLTAINELGVEGYLYGVMTQEVSPSWPMEALKAQAIVSRTYVMKNIGRFERKGFDLTSTITSQVYGGVKTENPKTNKAVDLTRGMVITYNGKLINAWFHSSCGGYTAAPEYVWPGKKKFPYLRGVTCPFCKKSPRYRWQINVDKEALKNRLKKIGYDFKKIDRIRILKRDKSGRVYKLRIFDGNKFYDINGTAFRAAIGLNVIKSTLFSCENRRKGIYFYGRGWGHGVGFCQWGAKGLAERGYNYSTIIKFYYRGVRIEKWKD